MSVKNDLRIELKAFRKSIHSTQNDERICKILTECEIYQNAETVLLYASLENEICIDSVIEDALVKGKKVALPVCVNSVGKMEFYYINSIKDLKKGFFSVREPDTDICKICHDFSNSICIVPGIAFDSQGYRLGYGKGYYDRFLQKFTSVSVGLCYNELVIDELPSDNYDIPVDYIITQDRIISVLKGEDNNGK